MAKRSPDQRNHYYLMEAARTGIHKPILAALYAAHSKPTLIDGETGLGVASANRIPLSEVEIFPKQVKYAANTIRSYTNQLTAAGWQSKDLWNSVAGRYSDRFLKAIAEGYSPPTTDAAAARLEPVDEDALIAAYLQDWATDCSTVELPETLAYLDQALLNFVERIPASYSRLTYQRQGLLEAVRLWRKLDTQQEVVAAFDLTEAELLDNETALDKALIEFVAQIDRYFAGYPNQREALLRLVQLWRELASRELAVQSLARDKPFASESHTESLDPSLMAFVQRIPETYQGRGEQRFALTEGYRLWQGLDSRTSAIADLGLDPEALASSAGNEAAMAEAASQIDRELWNFWQTVPTRYEGKPEQREALLQTVMAWRHLTGRLPTVQSLLEDRRRMERANRDALEAMPTPQLPPQLPPRPAQWTPDNIQLMLSILPNGSFTWAEATRGGTHMPPDQAAVDAIIRLATLAQRARDRIGRPFIITHWYAPAEHTERASKTSLSRHRVGDAMDFYCPGLTGRQLYWALDPWWPGGLGRYSQFPILCHVDARNLRSRWVQ